MIISIIHQCWNTEASTYQVKSKYKYIDLQIKIYFFINIYLPTVKKVRNSFINNILNQILLIRESKSIYSLINAIYRLSFSDIFINKRENWFNLMTHKQSDYSQIYIDYKVDSCILDE